MRRPQIRLSTLALLVIIAALAMGLIVQHRAHRREMAELRRSLGVGRLTVLGLRHARAVGLEAAKDEGSGAPAVEADDTPTPE